MRVVPFILILFILLFGAVAAVQTYNAPPGDATPTEVRPTVTPRPRPTSPRPTDSPAIAVPAPVATQAPAPTPAAPAPTPTPPPAAESSMKVGNTGGDGVYIRRTTNLDDKIRPWMDGTTVTVLGASETVNGVSWQKVRAPDGVEGYIPSQYLVP